jgi:hypothetical protein
MLKILTFLVRIRIWEPGSFLTLDTGSWMWEFRIRDKHKGFAKLKTVHQILVDVPDCFSFLFFSEFVSVGPVEKHVGRWRRRVYTHRSGLCCWGFYPAYSPTSYRYQNIFKSSVPDPRDLYHWFPCLYPALFFGGFRSVIKNEGWFLNFFY